MYVYALISLHYPHKVFLRIVIHRCSVTRYQTMSRKLHHTS